jgi:hypothetical protein
MVHNYYEQVSIVGGQTSVTLEDYLRGIMFDKDSRVEGVAAPEYTEGDLAYGLSLGENYQTKRKTA